MGFQTGVSNPCAFYHPERDITIVVHGDDFTALATDDELNWYETEFQKYFEIKIRGRLGEGCTGPQQIRILNRIVTADKDGLTYEADPRHTDLLLSSLNLEDSSGAVTPGVKPTDRDEHAIKSDEPDVALMSMNPDDAIAAICHGNHTMPCSHGNLGTHGEGRESVALGAAGHSGHCESKSRTDKANIATVLEVPMGNSLLGCANHLGHIDSSNSVILPYIKHCSNEMSVNSPSKLNKTGAVNSVHSK